MKDKAEFLIKAFTKVYKELPHTVGTPYFQYSEDIRDAKPGMVVTQYGDFFFIMPPRIGKLELPMLEVLLNKPFNGHLYQSGYDHQLQVRVSGYDVEKLMK
jgi:hypothetical protein